MARRKTQTASAAAGRTLLVLFFCAGIAFLGLLSGGDYPAAVARGGPDPMDGYYPPVMPRYPGSRELPAGPAGEVGRARVRMSFFVTADEPLKVARFYEDHWRQHRLFVRRDVSHVGGVISAVDSVGQTVYQALLSRRGDQTHVFPSITRGPLQAMDPGGQQPVVPLYQGSRAVITLRNTEGQTSALVTLSVNDGTLQENEAYYEQALQAAGFRKQHRQQPDGLGPQHRILLYRDATREVTVNLSALGERRTRVHLMEVGS